MADIPVVQLSIDRTQPPSFHHEIGTLLAPLQDDDRIRYPIEGFDGGSMSMLAMTLAS